MVIWVDPWVYSPAGLTWISYMVVFRWFHSCFGLLLEMSGKLGKVGVTAKARPLPIALQSQGLSLYLTELKGWLSLFFSFPLLCVCVATHGHKPHSCYFW